MAVPDKKMSSVSAQIYWIFEAKKPHHTIRLSKVWQLLPGTTRVSFQAGKIETDEDSLNWPLRAMIA